MIDCPHCQLSMQPQQYEGIAVPFCGTCWGHWVDDEAMKTILETEFYKFGSERKSVFEAWMQAAEPCELTGEVRVLACPVCHAKLHEAPFAESCPVVVDRCEDHGTWLDAGEIKQLQLFFEGQKSQRRR